MFSSVVGMLVPEGVRALTDRPLAIKRKLKLDLTAVAKIRNSNQKNSSIKNTTKEALSQLELCVPKDQTEVFKKHFSDVLEIVFETGCGGHCLFIDNKDFKSKAASNPRIHQSSSVDSKGKESKHFTWRPANGEELNIIFTSEIADVSITPSSASYLVIF